MRLDGDAALALQIHGVEHLFLHLPGRQRAGELEQTVGERALAVVDMSDNREISYEFAVHRAYFDSNRYCRLKNLREFSNSWDGQGYSYARVPGSTS